CLRIRRWRLAECSLRVRQVLQTRLATQTPLHGLQLLFVLLVPSLRPVRFWLHNHRLRNLEAGNHHHQIAVELVLAGTTPHDEEGQEEQHDEGKDGGNAAHRPQNVQEPHYTNPPELPCCCTEGCGNILEMSCEM